MDVRNRHAFTLVELLVVVAIVTLLVTILLPSLSRARTLARIAKAHSELRGITIAMVIYRHDNEQRIPPTRFSCSSRAAYDLPVELLPYLPSGRRNTGNGAVDVVAMPDPFTPSECYKYRAVGAAIMNESTILEKASTLWVPDGFPHAEAETGKYYNDPEISPVLYAVYSMGPDPRSEKFDVPGRLPVPRRYWLMDSSDTGVIVHFQDAKGEIHMSP